MNELALTPQNIKIAADVKELIAVAFDIGLFEASDTATLEVVNQKDEPLIGANGQPVTIELYGPGSSQYTRAQAKIDTASQTRAFAAIRGKTLKDGPDEARRLQAEKLAACTAKINNFPVTPLDLYSNPKLGYITNQVAKFVEDWSAFLSAASKA